jgi:2-polyprenyl-3-methyl-5-hydroxy-6-metoxy-1,4-benzoquinol methylase
MSYRARIYKSYASNVHEQDGMLNLSEIDRYGKAYEWFLRGWLPEDKQANILEVGCGYGRLLRFFSERGYSNVTGVDISPEEVELAKKIHPNVVHENALDFIEKYTEQFDLIVALDLIEHFHKHEVVRFLDACRQALRPGGHLVIQTPNADSPLGLMIRYGDFTHEVCFNLNSLTKLMKVCGFSEVEGREQGPAPIGILSFGRWILWKFARLFLLCYNLIEMGRRKKNIFSRVFIVRGVRS